jgi:hypothetical protein
MIRSRPTASFLGPASQPIDPARAPGVETTQSGDAAGAETTPFLAARGTAKPIQLRLGPPRRIGPRRLARGNGFEAMKGSGGSRTGLQIGCGPMSVLHCLLIRKSRITPHGASPGRFGGL